MPKVHSHYENLKVTRDAPLEVIRAAYRSLSQKYHPDRNSGNPDASRIMAILNAAFETLSDPEKRREHDRWIAEAEATGFDSQEQMDSGRGRAFDIDEDKLREAFASRTASAHQEKGGFVNVLRDPNISIARKTGHILGHIFRNWLWYGIAVFIIVAFMEENPSSPTPGPKPYIATPTPEPIAPAYVEPAPAPNSEPWTSFSTTPTPESVASSYVKPATAPNGEPWPPSSGYIRGYERLYNEGLSTVTIDNRQNDSDVFVKLVSLDGPNAYPVRTFFISAHGSFTLNQVNAGSYDIRYRDLDSGNLARSEAFKIEETPTYNGTQFSNVTLTLYKVQNGNMQMHDLAESEF